MWKKALTILVGLELGYCLLANVFLNAGFLTRLVNTDPESLELKYRWIFSPLPGTAWVSGLTLRVQDPNIQMHFALPSLKVNVDLVSLFKRKFRTTRVKGRDLVFHFRFRRAPAEALRVESKVLPPIEGLASFEKPAAVIDDPNFNPWEILIGGVDIQNIQEVWFDSFRYSGHGEVQGAFELLPKARVKVDRSTLTFHDGNIYVGDIPAFASLRGAVGIEISQFHPDDVPGITIFRLMSGQANLKAHIDSIEFMNYYFRKLKWVRVAEGKGDAEVDLKIEKGELDPGSRLQVASDKLQIKFLDQRAEGKGLMSWGFTGKDSNQLRLALEKYRLYHAKHPELQIHGSDLEVHVHTQSKNIADEARQLKVALDIPDAEINDVRYFNSYLPHTSPLQFKGGKGRVEVHLQTDMGQAGSDHGEIVIQATGSRLAYQKFSFVGDLNSTLRLTGSNIDKGLLNLPLSELHFRNVTASLSPDAARFRENWWADVSLTNTHVHYENKKDLSLHSDVAIRGMDGRPLAQFVSQAAHAPIPGWIIDLISFDNLKMSMSLQAGKRDFALRNLVATGNHCQLKGNLIQAGKDKEGKLLLVYGPFAAGLAFEGTKTRLRLQDALTWFNQPETTPAD